MLTLRTSEWSPWKRGASLGFKDSFKGDPTRVPTKDAIRLGVWGFRVLGFRVQGLGVQDLGFGGLGGLGRSSFVSGLRCDSGICAFVVR